MINRVRSRSVQDRINARIDSSSVYEIGFGFSLPVELSDGLTLTALASIDCERIGDSVEVLAYSLDGLELKGLTLDLAEFKRSYPLDFARIDKELRRHGEKLANETPLERWKYSGQLESEEL